MRARSIQQLILRQSFRAGVGHIGSALSVADILAVLYSGVLRHGADGDVFILSKGHSALALYCTQHLLGTIDEATLNTYCGDGTLLGVHPEHQLPGIDFSTGSLGQGLSIAVGSALGLAMKGSPARAYVLISDAELNEGSTWEGIMAAGHHRLGNLVAIIDANGQQALAHTADVVDLTPLAEKWRSFGWRVSEVDGHDEVALRAAFDETGDGRPHAVIASTVAGHGVSFMEGQVAWHYLPLSETQLAQALSEIGE